MNKLLLNKTNANFMANQLMGVFADMVAHIVVEKLKEEDGVFTKAIDVEAVTAQNEHPDELLTIKDVCGLLKVKRGTLNEWRKKGALKPDTYVGRSPRYRRSSIQIYVNKVKF